MKIIQSYIKLLKFSLYVGLFLTIHPLQSSIEQESYFDQFNNYYKQINNSLLKSFDLYKNKILELLPNTQKDQKTIEEKTIPEKQKNNEIAPQVTSEVIKVEITTPEENLISQEFESEKEIIESLEISEQDIIQAIQEKTKLIFDDNDQLHISIHLQEIKKLTQLLDPIKHKKIIDAVNFLIENQHKSRMRDIVFWVKATEEQKFHEVLPVPEHVAKMSKIKLFELLRKKMSLPIEENITIVA